MTAYFFWSDGNPIGLRLKPSPTSADSFQPHYNVVEGRKRLRHLSWDSLGRLVESRGDGRRYLRPTWKEIYITHRPPPESVVPAHANQVFVAMNLGSFVPFRISDNDVNALPSSPVPMVLTACTSIPLPWHGATPAILKFKFASTNGELESYCVVLHLARCARDIPLSGFWTWCGHWATINITTNDPGEYIRSDEDYKVEHNCASDHIDQWPDRTKTFPLGIVRKSDSAQTTPKNASIILRFEPCPMNPSKTLVTHITTRSAKCNISVCLLA